MNRRKRKRIERMRIKKLTKQKSVDRHFRTHLHRKRNTTIRVSSKRFDENEIKCGNFEIIL